MPTAVLHEVLASDLRQVPATTLAAGDVVVLPAMFTALHVERPDADGVARVASVVGPSVTGQHSRILARDGDEITWEIETTDGPVVTSTTLNDETRHARPLILWKQ